MEKEGGRDVMVDMDDLEQGSGVGLKGKEVLEKVNQIEGDMGAGVVEK